MTWKKYLNKDRNEKGALRFWNFLTLFFLILSLAATVRALETPAGKILGDPEQIVRPAELPPEIREKIARHIERAELEVQWLSETPLPGGAGAFRAANARRGLTAYFNEQGLFLFPAGRGEPAWRLEMALLGVGRDGKIDPAPRGKVEASGIRFEHRRGGLTEWYVNRPEGLEQGLTLMHRPDGSGLLAIEWSVSNGMTPRLAKNGLTVVFEGEGHGPVLRYGGLKAWDATGRLLTTRLSVYNADENRSPMRLAWVVDDAGAVYPVTVDPTFTEVKKIISDDGANNDNFGNSVCMNGDTLIVGAWMADTAVSNEGAAYVFYRDQGGADNWGQVRKLMAADGAASDQLGGSVSVSGDIAVIGAARDDIGGATDQGSAYVFYRNLGGADNWGQVAKIVAGDGSGDDNFGVSVSVSGDTVVIGSYYADIGANNDQGAAYVFYRNLGGADNWGQAAKLTAGDGAQSDWLGWSVSLDSDTVVVGAVRSDPGGNTDRGAAYVFERNQGGVDNWGQLKKLVAGDGKSSDNFGESVSINSDTIVVGANEADPGGAADQGAAYVFERSQGGPNNWGEVKKLVASDGAAGDYFGHSVSVSGKMAMVGAYRHDVSGAANQGAAWIYERNEGGADNWGQTQKLTATSGMAANDRFGYFVSISGYTAAAGALWADVGANTYQGAAWLFEAPAPAPPPTPPTPPVDPEDSPMLIVQKDGTGTGTVSSSPAGIDCGVNCNLACNEGDCFTLTGKPAAGSAFDGWSGVDCPGNGTCTATMGQDLTVTATFNTDGDSDGISDAVENAGPNGGDGNLDGILDSEQAEAATFQDINGGWCTLVSESGTVLTQAVCTMNPSPGDVPGNTTFPVGFLGFNIEGLTPGGSAVVTLILHGWDVLPDQYYRYGPTPDNNTDHWYDFSYAGGTGVKPDWGQSQVQYVLYFIDGQRGDDDLAANGIIRDLGGPAETDAPGGGGGGGSCFISTANP